MSYSLYQFVHSTDLLKSGRFSELMCYFVAPSSNKTLLPKNKWFSNCWPAFFIYFYCFGGNEIDSLFTELPFSLTIALVEFRLEVCIPYHFTKPNLLIAFVRSVQCFIELFRCLWRYRNTGQTAKTQRFSTFYKPYLDIKTSTKTTPIRIFLTALHVSQIVKLPKHSADFMHCAIHKHRSSPLPLPFLASLPYWNLKWKLPISTALPNWSVATQVTCHRKSPCLTKLRRQGGDWICSYVLDFRTHAHLGFSSFLFCLFRSEEFDFYYFRFVVLQPTCRRQIKCLFIVKKKKRKKGYGANIPRGTTRCTPI